MDWQNEAEQTLLKGMIGSFLSDNAIPERLAFHIAGAFRETGHELDERAKAVVIEVVKEIIGLRLANNFRLVIEAGKIPSGAAGYMEDWRPSQKKSK